MDKKMQPYFLVILAVLAVIAVVLVIGFRGQTKTATKVAIPDSEALAPLVPEDGTDGSANAKLPAPPNVDKKKSSHAAKGTKKHAKADKPTAASSPTEADDHDLVLVNIPTPKRVDFQKCTLKNARVKGTSVTWDCQVLVDYK